jgi:hypothetical protein
MGFLNLNTLSWVFGITSIIGVAGLIALAVFAPAVAQIILKLALNVISTLLSTRIGVALLVGSVCLMVGDIYGDIHGGKVARQACQAAQEQAEREAAERDKRQGNLADKDAQARLVAMEKDAAAYKEKINELNKILGTKKGPGCILTDEQLKLLR